MAPSILIATIMAPDGETGVQTHFNSFLSYLQKSGHKVDLVTPFSAPSWQVFPTFALRKIIDPINGSASVWWYRNGHEYFLHKALKKKLVDGEPCVVYAQCPLSARAALRARVSASQRVMMVVHFNVSQADEWVEKGKIPYGRSLYRSIQNLEENILPRLDGLVFVSEFMRKELIKRISGIKSVPYAVVHNFLSDPGVRDTTKIESDLISIGTLEPRKNQSYLLEIIGATRDQGSPLRLTLVGDGPDRKMLERKSRDLDISQYVHFTGFVSGAAQLLEKHKAYIHTAKMENFGIALIEALSRGLPVFAAPVGGTSEVFNDGVEGRYLPLDDASRAAGLILEWLGNPDKLSSAGQSGRERFLNKFESSVAAKQLTSFLLSDEKVSVRS